MARAYLEGDTRPVQTLESLAVRLELGGTLCPSKVFGREVMLSFDRAFASISTQSNHVKHWLIYVLLSFDL